MIGLSQHALYLKEVAERNRRAALHQIYEGVHDTFSGDAFFRTTRVPAASISDALEGDLAIRVQAAAAKDAQFVVIIRQTTPGDTE